MGVVKQVHLLGGTAPLKFERAENVKKRQKFDAI